MQSSSHELNTPVANSVYLKNICIKNSFAYTENDNSSELVGFQSQFKVSCMSHHNEELRYNKTVCL